MANKVIIGLLLAVGMVTLLTIGGWPFFVLIMAGAGMAMWEYYSILEKKSKKPMKVLGIVFGLAFITMAFLGQWYPHLSDGMANIGSVVSVYVILVLVIQFWQIVQRKVKYSIHDLSLTVFGSMYVGAFGSFLFLLYNLGMKQFPDSVFLQRLVLFLPMWGAWGSDVGAYFAGRFFGKNRIFPELSPKKTLEGCLGGMAMAVVGFIAIFITLGLPVGHAIIMGAITSAFGQIGDLSESALKREHEVKDSSAILGSHGGFLDRIDSLLFTAPVVFHYFAWVHPWG